MKINKLALIALLGGAQMAFGCSSDNGGDGGTGGGGTGGDEGVPCAPSEATCSESEIEAIIPCCDLEAPPADDNACTGDESLENPATCTATDVVVRHKMTVLKVAAGCDLGENIDSCDGNSCAVGGLAPGDGANGVDNAVYGLNAVLSGADLGNVGGVDQALADSFCGLTDPTETPLCPSPETIPVLEILLDVDANVDEGCANVTLMSGEATADVILNLTAPTGAGGAGGAGGADGGAGTVCASGTLGTIPISIIGQSGALANATVRMTVNQAEGFSNGLLSSTVDGETAVTIAELLAEGASAVVSQVFDIREDLEQDSSQACDSISATWEIGGVVVTGAGGNGG